MGITEQIEQIITPSLESMGYEVVRVLFHDAEGNRTLQIMVERLDEKPMQVDNCAEASGVVSALLDVEDPIEGRYHLEVSSAGIDRPLIKIKDFIRFTGYDVKIETKTLLNNRKRFKGKILKADEKTNQIVLEEATGEISLAFDDISKAKLILTDALLALHQQK
ncbi:MAG: ribosome maturation factor RimP [Alphaproteobacteria bacterium]|nr:ribosome maturation factor RimP [Alphaproteobacteria bacterium]NCB49833.1 ribosome maturation factor RimP [Alphaproteobacteria bacterium]